MRINKVFVGTLFLSIPYHCPQQLFASSTETNIIQQDTKQISLSIQNKELSYILSQIKKQTGLKFGFDQDCKSAKREIFSISVQNVNIESALTTLFNHSEYKYELNGNFILVKSRYSKDYQQTVQAGTLQGKVTDDQGEPIPGATVLLKGTTKGTTTDIDGLYTLNVPTMKNPVLVYSFIGMKSVEKRFSGQESMNVVLHSASEQMDEVVVTGIFTRKAESFTGSARTISADDLQRVGNGNIFQSLKNLDPSLNIMDNMEFGSDPNKLPSMQLRGTSTFPIDETSLKSQYQDDPNQPLFILDGFEVSATRIFDLDMNRVQSLTILKDASAKAIYGSKAANGVIVVETKKPLSGNFRVTYRGNLDVTAPDLSSYNLTNALEKLEVEKTAGLYDSAFLPSLQQNIDLYNQRMKLALEGLNTDWLSKPLHTGVGTKHSLSFEMGNDKINMIADFSYNKVTGVMKGSERNTLSGTLNASYRLNNRFLFRDVMSITYNKAEDSPYGSFNEFAMMNPYISPYDEKGNITPENGNPLYNGTINTKFTSDYLDFSNNFYVEYTILEGLKAVGRLGITTQRNASDRFFPANHTRFESFSENDIMRKGSYKQDNGRRSMLSGDLSLQYSKQIGKHFLMSNFAYSMSENKNHSVGVVAEGFPSDRMDDISFALQYAESSKPSGSERIIRDLGIVGVLGYTYDDRFLLDFTLRENASSQFGSNNRWGSFWSLGVGYNLHNEKWAKNLDWMEQLKLRASIGTTGSQSFASYQSLATYSYYSDKIYAGMLGSYMLRLANEDLKWQEKVDYNIGFDSRIAGLTLTFDYYISETDNLITDLSLPTSVGWTSVKENIGKVRNTGIDVTANYRLFSNKDGYLNLSASLSTNKNKILELSDAMRAYNKRQDELVSSRVDGGRSKPVLKYVEGGSMNSIWAVPSLGINPQNGKEIYVTQDGSTSYSWNASDQRIVGNSQPKYRGTFGFNGEYKGFGLGCVFRYLGGCEYYNQTLVDKVENADLSKNVDKRVLYGRWSETNRNAPFKSLAPYNDENGNYVANPKTEPTSRFVQDRRELTLASINAYYDMRNKKWMRAINMERLKFSFNMNDVCTISTIKAERGSYYPFARTMSFSLSAEF